MPSILWVPILFLTASLSLYLLSVNSPSIHEPSVVNNDTTTVAPQKETGVLKFPRTLEELTELAALLRRYRTDHIHYLVVLFCCAYLYKQTFAIPGSVFMNLLAGATFGVWYGFPLVCLLTATGATFCYLLSQWFGKYYVVKYLPDKVAFLQTKVRTTDIASSTFSLYNLPPYLQVHENRDSLFFYLLSIRLFPMSPNWLLNIVSPILNIPIHLFFISVLAGLTPYNFICVETGVLLSEIRSVNDIFTITTLLQMSSIAFMVLLPGILIRKYYRPNTRLKSE